MKEKKRALAHVEIIRDIQPIEGADRIEVATVLGWRVIVAKDENYNVGDKVIYVEIDSKLPKKPEYEFMAKRKYRVRTIKLRGQLSQGLILPLSTLGRDAEVGEDVTDELGITYYSVEDNIRKARVDKYQKMAQRHSNLNKKRWFKWLMKREWGRKLLFALLGNKKKDGRQIYPYWVTKTDEERIQNIPWILEDKGLWIATEKIHGTSSTYTYKKKTGGLFSNEQSGFLVCSRNVVLNGENDNIFYEDNYYYEMAKEYNIENVLKQMIEEHFPDANWITLQGETFGKGVQKKAYGLDGRDIRFFNLVVDGFGRLGPLESSAIVNSYGLKWVPIVDHHFIFPDTVDEMLELAEGKSEIDGSNREGIVLRSLDGQKSFKAISNSFLLKEGD